MVEDVKDLGGGEGLSKHDKKPRIIQKRKYLKYKKLKDNHYLRESIYNTNSFPGDLDSKESACNAGDPGSIDPWVGKMPWRREWQTTPVFLKSHRQRSLAGY